MAGTYDPPRIDERVDITNPLIGVVSPQPASAVFRPL